ncbi:site-specific integrase [Pseudarthrobacter sp. MDT3-26]|uniref:site-specific integrase n=1 Tax=Pseudarthrobacter raffinosi TaxID=2953651 RepID=UPI00208F49D7|nr:site-specific integrase [Pseudarthrobacter sp. MDT3-26]MCO4265062.1 site-specific integrase [Pseudarthrobacter sp. MDT3-26]
MKIADEMTVGALLSAYDEHLRRVRGVCPGTRRNYARHVGEFLVTVFTDGVADPRQIHSSDVVSFVGGAPARYRPRTVESAATSLRSFFRFLRSEGLCEDHLEDAVPMVPRRETFLVRHLDSAKFEQLIASLDSTSPRGLRDRAIILCVARLGLRGGEVAQLLLEDLDWPNATVRVRARKTGHGALLPLTNEVGAALARYLQHGRPATSVREVFVLQKLRVGAPISSSIVRRAVEHALEHAGMDAPTRGANLLRHSLATGLLEHGAGLPQIADLMGHSSLATTRIYAAVDVAALREVGLPWPEATS